MKNNQLLSTGRVLIGIAAVGAVATILAVQKSASAALIKPVAQPNPNPQTFTANIVGAGSTSIAMHIGDVIQITTPDSGTAVVMPSALAGAFINQGSNVDTTNSTTTTAYQASAVASGTYTWTSSDGASVYTINVSIT